MKALVLSGGGSRGAYQAGCWSALHDTGWRPDLVVGTSVGAINGAMIAARTPAHEMKGWWLRLRQKDILRSRRNVVLARRWQSLLDPSRLRALLEQEMDLDRLRQGTPLKVTATCLETAKEVVWDTPELTVDHFMASAALMPGLPPVRIGDLHYVDGGHWSALPLRHALLAGATDVHVLLHDPLASHDAPIPHGIRDMLRRQSDIIWHGRQAAEWEALQVRMELPKRHPLHLPRAKVTFHEPTPALANEILRFDPVAATKMWQRGCDETARRLNGTVRVRA